MNRESSRMTVSLTAAGSERWMVVELGAHALDHRDRVLAHRPADVEHHRGGLAEPDGARRPLEAVFRVPDVRDANRRAVPRRDDDVVEIRRRVDAAERAQQQLALALLDRAARDLDVLRHDRVAHLGDRQPVRVELLDVDDDVDLAGAAAGEADLADAVDRLDHARDLLVGQLGERAQAHRVGRHDERHHRIGVRIDLGDDRREQLRRHVPDGAGHLLAHVVGRVVEVALEDEADRDLAPAFRDARLNLVDPGDAADGLLHRLDDRRGHLVRARAGQRQRDADGRRVGFREQVDAETAERERPEHHERHHQHRGEHRAADAELRQHGDSSQKLVPLVSARKPDTTTTWSRSPARRRRACRRR